MSEASDKCTYQVSNREHTIPAEIIYRVFVSSTYDDLRDERAEIQKALLKLNCLPVAMELFPAADEETWEFIKRQIDRADYYIVIVAGRYGSVAPDGYSFTEKEHDYARQIGKPVLAFIHADPGQIVSNKTETDPGRRQKLCAFIEKLKCHPINQFRTPHELAMHVTSSMVDLRDRKPAIGYVRADQVADPKKYSDLLEENGRLKREMENGRMEEKFSAHDSPLVIQLTEKRHLEITWGELFVHVAEAVINNQVTDGGITRWLLDWAATTLADSHRLDFERGEFSRLKMKLFGWGLIEFDNQQRREQNELLNRFLASNYHVWYLTTRGRRQYGILMA